MDLSRVSGRPNIKNIFVLCPSYHGATLLSILLNNHSRITALGDTNPPRKFDTTCACGKKVSSCEFWQGLRLEAELDRFQELDTFLPRLPVITGHYGFDRVLNFGLAFVALQITPWIWWPFSKTTWEFIDVHDRFREYAKNKGNTDIFVNGEKSSLKTMVLKSLGHEDISIIHITRDPRGYCGSMVKNKGGAHEAAAEQWRKAHERVLYVRKFINEDGYHHVRYEDLTTAPQETMEKIFSFIGVENENTCKPLNSTKCNHLVGNRMLREFDGTIIQDVNWKDSIPKDVQRSIIRSTQPLFRTFLYE